MTAGSYQRAHACQLANWKKCYTMFVGLAVFSGESTGKVLKAKETGLETTGKSPHARSD